MVISKQHYAQELASLGSKVYFLNPPLTHVGMNAKFRITEFNEQITIVNYVLPYIGRLKYRTFSIFSRVNRFYIERFFKQSRIDIVWNFDNGLVTDILPFRNASLNIFHPVDQLRVRVKITDYHYVFSLSRAILKRLNHHKKFFINHGLNSKFEALGNKTLNRLESPLKVSNQWRCAYVGNLLSEAIDRKNFIEIIAQNPDIIFELIGAYEAISNNLTSTKQLDSDTHSFIQNLRALPNANLLGPMSHDEIIQKSEEIDLFFICYKMTQYYKCDNSHKILEYLSTGKPVISSYLSVYDGLGLVEMVDIGRNHALPELIKKRFKNYHTTENCNRYESRVRFALSNTYRFQLKEIESIVFNTKRL